MVLGLIGGALFAGAAIFDGIQRSRSARESARFQRRQFNRNRELALLALTHQTGQIRRRTLEERAQIGEQIRDLVRGATTQRGAVAASAGQAGVAGASVNDLLLDSHAQEARTRGQLRVLQENRERDAEARIRALVTQTESRINAGLPGPMVFPSALGIGLRAGAGALQGAAAGASLAEALG